MTSYSAPLIDWSSGWTLLPLTALALLLYTYAGYPALLALLAQFSRRRRREPGYTPSVTVLIAAYNEEAAIEAKVRQTLALDYPADRFEVLVVSDASSDRTDEIVRSIDDPRVRLLRMEPRGGKTNGQNHGLRVCSSEVVVFSDATSIYHPKALRYLAANYADPRVGAVSGRYKYFDPDNDSPTGLGSVAFWNYENLIKLFQSRLGTLTGCSGCIYSVRRACYVPLPAEACSDLVEPLHIVRNGYRVAFEDRALAYEATTKNSAQEFRMRVRVATRGMRGVLSVADLLVPWRHPWPAWQLISHKILRWMAPLWMLLLLVGSGLCAGQLVFRVLFAAQAVFYCFVLSSLAIPVHRQWKPLAIPLFFCTLNAAMLVGMWQIVRGQRFTTWQTVR